MGSPPRRERRSNPAVAAAFLILLIGVAVLTLYGVLERRLLQRWLLERQVVERERVIVEEPTEPGALPPPGPTPAPPPAPAPTPVPRPGAAPPAPRADTLTALPRPDTLAVGPRAGVTAVRSFGIAAFEERILARLDRERAETRPLTGVARVEVEELRLEDPAGGRFATAERLDAGIDLGALYAGDVVISDAVVLRPDVRVRGQAGRPWNFEAVWRALVGSRPAAPGAAARVRTIRLLDILVRDGSVEIESPTTRLTLLDLDADIARAAFGDSAPPAPEIVVRTASAQVVLPEADRRFAATVTAATVRPDGDVLFTAAAGTLDGAHLSDIRGAYRPATGLELALRGEDVPLADLQWLVPELPDQGTASFTLALEPLADGRTRVALTELDARSGDSHLTGALAVALGGPGAMLESADLRADALELRLLEPLIGEQPFNGRVTGAITASAGVLRFDVAAVLSAGEAQPFTADVTGAAEYGPAGFRLTSLVADLADVPLAALRPLIPGLPLAGTVSGRISVLGAPGAVPLEVDVRLALSAGTLALRGALDLRGPVATYDLTGQVLGLSLAALFGERAPPARLTADFSLAGTGTDLETASLRLALAGRFTGWRTDPGDRLDLDLVLERGVLRLERGLLSLATLELQAGGTWRFVPPAAGGLQYALRVTDLAPFGPYLPLATQGAAAGELAAEGSLTGPAGRARLDGVATGAHLRLDGWRAASLEAAYAVTAAPAPEPPLLSLTATARGLEVPGLGAYDTAAVVLSQTPPLFSFTVEAERRGGGVLEAAADGRILEGGRRDAVVRRFVADAEGSRWTLAQPAGIAWGGAGGLDIRGLLLVEQGGPGRLAADGRIARDGASALSATATAVPIGGLLALATGDTTATGRLWMEARVAGVAAAPIVDADFRVEQASIQRVTIGRLEGDLRYAGRRLQIDAQSRVEPARALEVRASLPFELTLDTPPRWRLLERGPVSGTLVADSVGLAAFEPWLRDVRDLEGAFSGRATVAGTIEDPRFDGAFALRGGAATIAPLNQRYTEISADVALGGARIVIEDLRARSDGWASASGTLVFAEPAAPVLDLTVAFDGFRAFSARGQKAAALTGTLDLTGPLTEPVVGGRVVIEDGTVPVNAFTTADETDLLLYGERELLAAPPIDDDGVPPPAPFLSSVTFDELVLVAGDDLWFVTDGTRAQLAGDVVVVGTGENIRAFGTLVGERGRFTLEAGPVVRRFDVERAEVRFLGTTPPDPTLDVTAVRTVPLGAQREIAIVARITGTASAPVVAFTTPEGAAIPESELLSFLVFGRPSFVLGEAEFLGQGLLGEFFLTGITELTAIELEQELAAELGLDFFEIRPGFGAFGGLGLPALAFGREIAEDVFLTVELGLGRLAGVETAAAVAVRLQWRIDDQWQLELALEPATRARLLRGGTVALPLAPPEQQLIIIVRRRWTY